MIHNRKALLLIELSVLIIATMIIFMAVSNSMSSQNQIISRLAENNDVLMILDSFGQKLKTDYDNGVVFDEEYLQNYRKMLSNCHYRIEIDFLENGNAELVLTTMNFDFTKTLRRYRKEVRLNGK